MSWKVQTSFEDFLDSAKLLPKFPIDQSFYYLPSSGIASCVGTAGTVTYELFLVNNYSVILCETFLMKSEL